MDICNLNSYSMIVSYLLQAKYFRNKNTLILQTFSGNKSLSKSTANFFLFPWKILSFPLEKKTMKKF